MKDPGKQTEKKYLMLIFGIVYNPIFQTKQNLIQIK